MVEEAQKFGDPKKDGRLHLKKDVFDIHVGKFESRYGSRKVFIFDFERFDFIFRRRADAAPRRKEYIWCNVQPECASGNYCHLLLMP